MAESSDFPAFFATLRVKSVARKLPICSKGYGYGGTRVTAPGATAAGQGGAAAFGDPARVDAAHQAIRADASIQWDLPWVKPPDIQPPPEWLAALFRAIDRAAVWIGGGWKVLMWVAIAIIVIALALAIFPAAREWLAARLLRRKEAPAAKPGWAPDAGVARALLDEADRLAAAGRYAEAVRLILHRSIEDIEKWRGDPLRPSLTSRDIAAFDGLPDTARTVFGRIVADVERSLFGGDELGQADWTRARADYAAFALGRRQ